METLARENGVEFKDLPREQMETYWDSVKKLEGKPHVPEMSGAQTKR